MDLLWRISTAVVDERLRNAESIRAHPRFELGVASLNQVLPCDIPSSTPPAQLYRRLTDCALRDGDHAMRYFRHRASVRGAAATGALDEDETQPWDEEAELFAEGWTGLEEEIMDWDEEDMFDSDADRVSM